MASRSGASSASWGPYVWVGKTSNKFRVAPEDCQFPTWSSGGGQVGRGEEGTNGVQESRGRLSGCTHPIPRARKSERSRISQGSVEGLLVAVLPLLLVEVDSENESAVPTEGMSEGWLRR